MKPFENEIESNIEEITHTGRLDIGGMEIHAYVTKSNKRLISAADMFTFTGRSRRGQVRIPGLPAFIGAKNLLFYMNDDLKKLVQPIKYKAKNGKIAEAYDATVLPEVADLYIAAHEDNVLMERQQAAYQKSLILIRSLAKVGIVSLIDEATGFQFDRDSQNLQMLLKAYISKDVMKWQRRFPREFYEEIYRLYGYSENKNVKIENRAAWIGNFTNTYVYGVFPDDVMDEIRKKNPVKESERGLVYRSRKHFQHLTDTVGLPQLDKHLAKLIGVMQLSENKDDFKINFEKVFKKDLERKAYQDDIKNGNLPLDLDEH